MQAIIRIPRSRRWVVALMLLVAASPFFWGLGRVLQKHGEDSQDEVILAAARRYGVHPALVKAVVWQESRFKPGARGRAGELGLMQIRRDAAHEWAEAERLPEFDHIELVDPRKNTLAGAWYLSKLLRRYRHTDNPVPYALADYNAGRSNVLKWNRRGASTNSLQFVARIGFPATRAYVKAVMKRYDYYRAIFPPKNSQQAYHASHLRQSICLKARVPLVGRVSPSGGISTQRARWGSGTIRRISYRFEAAAGWHGPCL